MELTKEMAEQLKTVIADAVAASPVVKERDELKTKTEDLEQLVIKQGEAIQELGAAFKKSVDDGAVTREAVEKIVDGMDALKKFVGANGAPKSLDEEDAPATPVAKAADDTTSLESALMAVLPAQYGGSGSAIALN